MFVLARAGWVLRGGCGVWALRGGCGAWVRHSSSKRWLDRQRHDPYTRRALEEGYVSRAAFKLLELNQKHKLLKPYQKVVDLGYAPGAWSQAVLRETNNTAVVLGVDILVVPPPAGVLTIQGNIMLKHVQSQIRLFFAELHRSNQGEPHKPGMARHRDSHETEASSYYEEIGDEPVQTPAARAGTSDHDGTEFPVDVIISDMCASTRPNAYHANTTNLPFYRLANTTGIKFRDHLSSMVRIRIESRENSTNRFQDLCYAALILAIDLLRPGGSFTCKFYSGGEEELLHQRLKKVFRHVTRDKPDASRSESKEYYWVCKDKREGVTKEAVFA